MSIELILVAEAEKDRLASLVNDYLVGHCRHQENSVGPRVVGEYVYYPAYWREKGRYPYFIKTKATVIGFVLVRTVYRNSDYFYQVSDFYIKPEFEGRGYGTQAIAALWAEYPGRWELQVLRRNLRARHFWARCIEKFARGGCRINEVELADGKRYQYNFVVAASA